MKKLSILILVGAFSALLSACAVNDLVGEESIETESTAPVETTYEIEAVVVESENTSDADQEPEEYEESDLVQLASFYYRMTHNIGNQGFSIDLDSIENGMAKIHLYIDNEDTTETLAWYDIDIKTLQGQDSIFEEPVDFSDVVFFLNYSKEHEDTVIPCLYSDDTYYVFSAGAYEGSMGVFNGTFNVYDKIQKGYIASENLTDEDQFLVIDQSIYFDKTNLAESGFGIYKVNFALQKEELVSDLAEIISFDQNFQTLFVAKSPSDSNFEAALNLIDMITGIEKTVFDPSSLKWKTEEGDKIKYQILDFDGETIQAIVYQYGYREGESIGWRDTLVNSKEIEVSISMNAADIFTPITDEEYEKFKKTVKKTDTSDFDDFAELMEKNYLGTWYDPESKEAIRLTEKGAYVYIPYLDIYGNECYEWELIDRSKEGKCPELAIYYKGRESGELAYYIAGYRDGYFYGESQGYIFYLQ